MLHLIKSCEIYDLKEKESVDTINNLLNKNISRRTYYNYKKRPYDKEIFQMLKDFGGDRHLTVSKYHREITID